ncbi:MAG: aminoacyl-tRNA hydrolase [Clostridiales bacterium]|nr:aminoacyl-tRNA hydrolase [Clostridiales bacterium]
MRPFDPDTVIKTSSKKETITMHIIAGLGNPGLSYKKTRHNSGFQALDCLAEAHKISVKQKKFSALCGEGTINGERVLLLKPQTYMNRSGDAIGAALRYYNLPTQNLIVLYDDVDLPVGTLRIRERGSAGTHNGMRHIIACLGGGDFPRLRIGVGQDKELVLADYVLKRPGKDEQALLTEAFQAAAAAAALIVRGELHKAQELYQR